MYKIWDGVYKSLSNRKLFTLLNWKTSSKITYFFKNYENNLYIDFFKKTSLKLLKYVFKEFLKPNLKTNLDTCKNNFSKSSKTCVIP